MKTKTPILLTSLIVLPLLLLAWFGVRLHYNQQQLVQLQLGSLIENRLAEVDQQLLGHFNRLEQALNDEIGKLYRLKDPTYTPPALRNLVAQSPQLESAFVLDSQGERLFPPQQGALPRREQAFIEKTRALLSNPRLFSVIPNDSIQPQPAAIRQAQEEAEQDLKEELGYLRNEALQVRRSEPTLEITSRAYSPSIASPELPTLAKAAPSLSADYAAAPAEAEIAQQQAPTGFSPSSSGWIAWYNDTRLQHIYWAKDNDGETLGFAINGARLVADLIGLLPASNQSELVGLTNAEIRLINNRGELVYAWGQLNEDTRTALKKPLKMLPVSHPLGSWKLEYYAPAISSDGGSLLGILSLILFTLFGLSTLGWIIHREHNRELELAQQRVNFVNQVSHELKTPLTNVRMYAEMLERQLEPDEEQHRARRYVGVITNESQRLSRLIDNVLSFSRLGRGKLTISPQPGHIAECLETVVETFTPVLAQRGMEISLKIQDDPQVQFDTGALEQIVNNLLSNCEKYAPESGTITVDSWHSDGTSYIRVQDQGPGIATVEHQRIFTPFYRCSNQLTDGVTGTGIGLGLARDLARAHGGDLVIEPSDKGARFLISLHTGTEN